MATCAGAAVFPNSGWVVRTASSAGTAPLEALAAWGIDNVQDLIANKTAIQT